MSKLKMFTGKEEDVTLLKFEEIGDQLHLGIVDHKGHHKWTILSIDINGSLILRRNLPSGLGVNVDLDGFIRTYRNTENGDERMK